MTKAEISPIRLAVVIATRKAVFRDRNLIGMSSMGSKGGLVRASKTNDRFQGGTLILTEG